MDTNVFGYVKSVAECGSISAASRKMFISQPALTKQISRLEHQLGVKLFERKKTPLAVTPSGELFLEFASRYLKMEAELMESLGQTTERETERVTVATTHRGGGYVGNHTAAFLTRYQNIQLEYLDMSATECEAALENEMVNLAVYTDPVISDKIEYMPLEEDRLIFVVPKDSILVKDKDISNNSLTSLVEIPPEEFRNRDITYILSTPNHSLYYAECAFFKKYKINPVRTLRVDYVDTRYSIACGGSGIVLVPTTTAKKDTGESNVVFCTVKGDSVYRYVIIAKKKGRTLSRGAEIVWRFMVEQKFRNDNKSE